MFNIYPTGPEPRVGERTRALILGKALELFRSQGFDRATMRDIARSAEVATGAAYYYFPSKEAIVSAYYDRVQEQHAERVAKELAGKQGLRERLGVVLHTKLEMISSDRAFLGALFRYSGLAGHPLSVFEKGTAEQRNQSIQRFREAIAGAELSEELQQILPWVMWLAHLGMILFFIYDDSEGQTTTRQLVDGVLDLLVGVVGLTSSALLRPVVKPFEERVLKMLREVGIAPAS